MSNTQSLKLYSQQPNGVTFSDPNDPDYQVRFKTTSTAKMLDGSRTTNFVTEVIVNDNHLVNIGDKQVSDAISVRVRVSGAAESHEHLKIVVKNLASQLATWADEDVFVGFRPDTLPTRDLE